VTFARRLLIALGAAAALAPMARAEPAGWQFRSMGGVVCRAVLRGDTIDTQLMRSGEGGLVLVAGFPGQLLPVGDTKLTLAIDGGAASDMTGQAIGGIVLVVPLDAAQAAQIKAAQTLKWHFPWGDFTAAVTGLGAAFDAIAVCRG
jgi:hypothetical protein